MSQHPQSLAYQPKEFFELGAVIAGWCADEDIYASFPDIHENAGRIYYMTQFGYCPNDSGVTGLFAWDELNKEYLYWDSEDPDFDWESSVLENAEVRNGKGFETLEALTHFVKTGES